MTRFSFGHDYTKFVHHKIICILQFESVSVTSNDLFALCQEGTYEEEYETKQGVHSRQDVFDGVDKLKGAMVMLPLFWQNLHSLATL